uniref:Peptidase M12A domain-containing protein n=1 Tax=Meloidogyne javanica TaxID=6303 RepID=A0A915N3A2_MELJA
WAWGQFDRDNTLDFGTPYDFGSIMQYGSKDFYLDESKYTILALQHAYQNSMGQGVEPSFKDAKLLNRLYCTSEYPHDTSTLPKSINFGCDVNEYELNNGRCRNGGYPDPLKNCKCRCPDGYGGNKCDKYEYANCKVIELKAKLQQNDDKIDKIGAKRITIKIEKLEEIKYRKDKSATGARICCIDYKRLLTINSEDDTEVLIMKRGNIGEFDISYQKELAPSQAASNCIEVRKSIYNPMYLQHYRVILKKKIELPPTYGPRFCLACNRNRSMIVCFSRDY